MKTTVELIKKNKNTGKEEIVKISAIHAVDVVKTRDNFSYPQGMDEKKMLKIASEVKASLNSSTRTISVCKKYSRKQLEEMPNIKLHKIYEIFYNKLPDISLERTKVIQHVLLAQEDEDLMAIADSKAVSEEKVAEEKVEEEVIEDTKSKPQKKAEPLKDK
jgi:hypothetical protein